MLRNGICSKPLQHRKKKFNKDFNNLFDCLMFADGTYIYQK